VTAIDRQYAATQLGLDGSETPHPVRAPHALTDRQRALLVYIRAHESVRPLEVGVFMHQGRPEPCVVLLDFRRMRVGCCRYASSDGVDALIRLARRGLVVRVRRGVWQAVTATESWT
jgi:hypothetical protein